MKQLEYSVVIPSNRVRESIKPLLDSLAQQSLVPKQVFIVRDRYASKAELDSYTISTTLAFASVSTKLKIIHPLNNPDFGIGKGASYVRNYGINKVTSPYLMIIDDDNTCPSDMAQNLFEFVTHHIHPQLTFVAPLQYDSTHSTIRPALARGFNFTLCRPRRVGDEILRSSQRYTDISLASSNCLAGPRDLFLAYPFPLDVPFVYEDLIMTARASRAGVQILADSWASVVHHHSHRSKLSEMYANTPERAYRKAKHRIMLVHTLGSKRDLIVFYSIGFLGQLGRIALHILLHTPPVQRSSLFQSLIKGTKDGFAWLKTSDNTTYDSKVG